MTHEEARLLIGAAPGECSDLLAAHVAGCAECALFQQQMRRMDQDLARLLSAPLPPRAAARVLPLPVVRRTQAPRRTGVPGRLAMAASFALCVGLATLFWTLRPQPSLAAGVLQHIEWESASWSTVAPMTAAATEPVLSRAGVSLDPDDMTVTYARTCLFDGHWVPHLVVHTDQGPVTVMVLRQERIKGRRAFRQNGYSGVLVPAAAGGTLAVVARGDTDLDAVTRTLDAHLHWTR